MRLFFLVLSFFVVHLQAQMHITDTFRESNISAPHAEYGATPKKGMDTSRYWIKAAVICDALRESFYLECQSPNWSDIQVMIDEGDTSLYAYPITGAQYPFVTRPLQHKNFIFPLPQKSTKYTIWIGLDDSQVSEFSVMIRSNSDFVKYALTEYFLLGLYYGFLVLVALYNALLYFRGKLKLHLFYVLYIVGCIFMSFREDGLAYHFLWPACPGFNYYVVTYIAKPFFMVSFLLYATAFLGLHKMHKAAKPAMMAVVALYIPLFVSTRPLTGLDWWSESVFVATFLAVYASSIFAVWRGNRFAYYFFIGFSFVLMSMLLNLFRHFAWIPSTIFTVYSYNFAILAEVIIFSFALAERIRSIQDEKAKNQKELLLQLHKNDQLQKSLIVELDEKRALQHKVNAELEQKVGERTAELKLANEKLSEFAQKMDQMNSALDLYNHQLKKEIKEEKISRIFHEELSFEQFCKTYPTEETCMKEIYTMKWSLKYVCKKCNNDKAVPAQDWHRKKCSKCGYIESTTAHTLYHHLKFPIHKAFYITYAEVAGLHHTNEELSKILDLRKPTVWAFKQKVQERMADKKYKKAKSWKDMILD